MRNQKRAFSKKSWQILLFHCLVFGSKFGENGNKNEKELESEKTEKHFKIISSVAALQKKYLKSVLRIH